MDYFTSVKSNAVLNNTVLLITRIFVGFAMLSHGFPKLQMLLDGGEIQFYSFIGLGAKMSLALAVFAEFVCSIFLILGLFTRWAAFFLAFTMCVAVFGVHSADGFDKMETGALYLSLYLIFLILGPGKFSVDGMISYRRDVSRSAW
ncbi:DoxX family protein [Daejeonia sp. YH14]|uniref:DoxX family protein n=1 Tax=Daejeonia sp. YH14 TaxID=3439042 RepID=UPI003F49A58C